MELFYDTETSGLPNGKPWIDKGQPHVIQLGFILSDKDLILNEQNILIKPTMEDWSMHPKAEAVHGISKERVMDEGYPASAIAQLFIDTCAESDVRICHNTRFDQKIMTTFLKREGQSADCVWKNIYCTMLESTALCKLPGRYGRHKWPSLQELHKFFFEEGFDGAHDALEDVRAMRRCYYLMKELGL